MKDFAIALAVGILVATAFGTILQSIAESLAEAVKVAWVMFWIGLAIFTVYTVGPMLIVLFVVGITALWLEGKLLDLGDRLWRRWIHSIDLPACPNWVAHLKFNRLSNSLRRCLAIFDRQMR